MLPKIVIFSAPVNTGKTTKLMNWAKNRSDVGGILAPDIDGLRHLYTLRDRQLHPYQLSEAEAEQTPDEQMVSISKFNFSAEAMRMARQTLLEDSQHHFNWVVVDEVGKLEVAGGGLEPAVTALVQSYQSGAAQGRLLLVVREQMVKKVAAYLGVETYGHIRLGEAMPA